jgi:hypothetical protein
VSEPGDTRTKKNAERAAERAAEWLAQRYGGGGRGTCAHDEADSLCRQLAEAVADNERLLHGICDALDPGHPTEPILRALLRGTEHEHHRDEKRP